MRTRRQTQQVSNRDQSRSPSVKKGKKAALQAKNQISKQSQSRSKSNQGDKKIKPDPKPQPKTKAKDKGKKETRVQPSPSKKRHSSEASQKKSKGNSKEQRNSRSRRQSSPKEQRNSRSRRQSQPKEQKDSRSRRQSSPKEQRNSRSRRQSQPKEQKDSRQRQKSQSNNAKAAIKTGKGRPTKAKDTSSSNKKSLPKRKNSDSISKNDESKAKIIKKDDQKASVSKADYTVAAVNDLANSTSNTEPEKIKKVILKGGVPIDQHANLDHKLFHVLQHGGKTYSATLNQTNVSNNNNKFYIIQVIQNDNNQNNCYFFTRWGRVGVPGQQSLVGPYPLTQTIKMYEQKYHQKKNKGDYRQVEICYDNEDQKQKKNTTKSAVNQNKDYENSTLEKPVKDLIELIFDMSMMDRQMKEIGYNTQKMPLGKLSKDNILRGYQILKNLLDEIKGQKRSTLIQSYTNDFYSIIPHDFGFKHMSNFTLNTQQQVKKKLQLLEALAQIKIATSIIDQGVKGNRIDSNYEKLQRTIKSIPRSTQDFRIIEKYLQTTHATTHRNFSFELVDLFSIEDERENVRFTKDIHNKTLLWHGSRLTNFVGILSQGLRIAPPEAPVTGYMFGKGVYFADMSSKSANYCFTTSSNNTGILLLCQVALGDMNLKYHADFYASNLPPGKHSTKGCGKTAPLEQNAIMLDGVKVPMGPGQPTGDNACSLLYNEYIVYDVAQIRIKYLLRTKFHYNR